MAQKIGISLAGGAAMGYAHLGFLQAMDDAGVKVNCITGTSIGAVIGVLYAAGYSPYQMLVMLTNEGMHRIEHIYRPNLHFSGGLVDTTRLQRKLLKYIPHNSFESLDIPYYCCVLNMNSLEEKIVSKGGQLVKWVMASAAIPPFFAPVKINGFYYYDGGLVDIMPVEPLLQEKCDRRIGVRLTMLKPDYFMKPNFMNLRALEYMTYSTANNVVEQFTDNATIDCGRIGVLGFRKIKSLYEIGYKAGSKFFKEHDFSDKTETEENYGINQEDIQRWFGTVEQPYDGATQGGDDVPRKES